MRFGSAIQIIHKNLAVKFAVLSRLFNSLAGCNVLYKILETFVRIRLDVAADDSYFGNNMIIKISFVVFRAEYRYVEINVR